MAISSQRAAAGFAPPSSAGRSNTAPTNPGTSKPSTILTSSPTILSIWQASSAADDSDLAFRPQSSKRIVLRPVRFPAPTPTPSPIQRVRTQGPPRQALLLKAAGKRICAGVKTVAHASRLILAANFFRRDTGGHRHKADYPREIQTPRPPLDRSLFGTSCVQRQRSSYTATHSLTIV